MTDKTKAFFDQRDENGLSNREKIRLHQQVIRRLPETDKTKSYEASSARSDGIVMQNGKMIGFGIHILNEDIYPLQSFEIYLRNCDLTGSLDLSGQPDLLFVDIYHNRISEIKVDGDSKLRILGIQDNKIRILNTSGLTACLGIDAGMNELETLDVTGNPELVELYINDNHIRQIDLSECSKLKYFYCHNNPIQRLDTRSNPMLPACRSILSTTRSGRKPENGSRPISHTRRKNIFLKAGTVLMAPCFQRRNNGRMNMAPAGYCRQSLPLSLSESGQLVKRFRTK